MIETNAYTYLIGWTTLGQYYYGRRTAKGASPVDLWKTYFTSSLHVKQYRSKHGDPDLIVVRKAFGADIDKCKRWEHTVLRRLRVDKRVDFLNKSVGGQNFDTTGMRAAVCAITGNRLGMQSVDAGEWSTGQWVSPQKGKNIGMANAQVLITGEKIGKIHKSDPRWHSGEIVAVVSLHRMGKTTAVHQTTGERFTISCSDPRLLSGELKNTNAGRRCGEYAKQVASATHKGKAGSMLGKKHSLETRQKLGKRPYDRGGEHVAAKRVSINGTVYSSLSEAVRQLGIKESTLRDYLKGTSLGGAAKRGLFNLHYVRDDQMTSSAGVSSPQPTLPSHTDTDC